MYIAIDFGGTNTRVATSPTLAPLEIQDSVRYRNTQDYETDLAAMIRSIDKISHGEKITAIGIGTPGLPNTSKTQIQSAVNVSHWAGKPLTEPLRAAFNCPVYFDNDGVAAATAEVYYGGLADGDFHYIIWGTGIGGAQVIFHKDQVFDVAKLAWREHFAEWEEACSGASLTKTYGTPPEEFDIDTWQKIHADFAHHLERYITTFSPRAIIFGGGLAVKNRESLMTMKEAYTTPIHLSEFGTDSGLIGGFGLVRHSRR